MLIPKREEVTKQDFCKILLRKLRPLRSLLLEFIHSSGWGGGGRLFEVGANLRLCAYLNKYGIWCLNLLGWLHILEVHM